MTENHGDAGALELVGRARVDADVFALRPDYRVLLIAADGLVPGPADAATDALVESAHHAARVALERSPVDLLPHVAAWREAYRAFGAKPQRTRNSLEALLRRTPAGLPRVNRLTDLYNAISVLHQIPLGGEDLSRYSGPPHLKLAAGTEQFDTTSDGTSVTEHPEPGEVVWCDNAGVTCRRWNWRQGRRTQLSADTTTALFILDALAPLTDAQLEAAADDLEDRLLRLGPDVRTIRRLITDPTPIDASTGAPVICCQFIFKPGTYDEDFHRLDQQIDDYARNLPGFDRVEKWLAPEGGVVNAMYYFADQKSVAHLARFPTHREAKGQVQRWYDGYRIVISEVKATYGDGRLD